MPSQHRAATAVPLLSTLAAVLAVTACAPEPFIDMRREAGRLYTVGASTLDRPAVCYNTMNATREEVQALADAVCAETGRVAVYESTDVAQCTVLQPHRSLFTCVAPDSPLADPDGVRTVRPGVLGVQVPGQQGAPAAPVDPDPDPDAPAEGEVITPAAPPAPARPPSPLGDEEGPLD